MTLDAALRQAALTIARRDAEVLLIHLLRRDRAWLLTHGDDPLASPEQEIFFAQVRRRAAREPLQYITGEQEFYGLALKVTRDTLIPRPETEHLVEAVELWARRHGDGRTLHIADVGTGTGAIAIALAARLPNAVFVAIDSSEAALAIALENAETHGYAGRISFLHNDLLASFDRNTPGFRPFDCIVSNPPYIPTSDVNGMQPEVRDYEPHRALFAGDDGLDIYRRLIPQAEAALARGGLLAMEIGFGQRDALASLFSGQGSGTQDRGESLWSNVRFLDDYAGIPRVVLAEKRFT